MATLIDSSVLIAVERGHLNFDDISARYAEDDVAKSAVTASDMLHGLQRTRTAAQRHRRQAFVEGLLAQLPVIAFDLTVALEQSNKTKGTYRFDSPNPDAPIASIYVRKSAFDGGAVPKRIVLTVAEAEG